VLTRIFADNFRALVNFELRPETLTLLLGANGSGKSSVFQVLGVLSDIIVRGNPIGSYLRYSCTTWDTREVQTFELDFKGPDGALYRYVLTVRHPAGRMGEPAIETEKVEYNGAALFEFSNGQVHLFNDEHVEGPVFPFLGERSFLSNLTSPGFKLGWFLEFVRGITILQMNPFEFGLMHEREDSFLNREGRNFSAFWDHLGSELPDIREQCVAQLRVVMPGFQNFRLVRAGNQKQLVFDFKVDGLSYSLPAATLSEGQRTLSTLYAALWGLVGRRSLVCFDEPDNFVGLSEIQPWLQSMRDRLDSSTGGQVMIISHHPEVIDYLAVDSAFRFERSAGNVIARPLESLDSLSELKLSEIIARGG